MALAALLVAMLVAASKPAMAAAGPPPAAFPAPATVETVVELLRLRVPAAARRAWLTAERNSWEPWLRRQPGFRGRQLLWEAEREEGILLIHWASREAWKAIPQREIDATQARFEAEARAALGLAATAANPFPLVRTGEIRQLAVTTAAAAEADPPPTGP
jgi:uncharacterized protein (TIGR03792 family)